MDKHEPWLLLTERAKELECIYAVDEVLQDKTLTISQAMSALTQVIPPGFTCPKACRVRILLNGNIYSQPDFERAEILHSTPIITDANEAGHIQQGYIKALLGDCDGALLDSEIRLLDTIASHIARLVFYSERKISMLFDMLLRINPDMLLRICDKLRLHLSGLVHDGQSGDIDDFFKEIGLDKMPFYGEVNSPLSRLDRMETQELIRKVIAGGTKYMSDSELLDTFNRWIQDERAFALVKAVGGNDASVSDILDALRQYAAMVGQDGRGNALTETWLVSELAHRFLTDDEQLINLVLDTFKIEDFQPMLERNIGSPKSRGHVGGKGAGIFIAQQVLAAAAKDNPLLADIKTPRTWYIAADHLTDFIHYNHLEELHSYKYNSPEHLRITYGQVVSKVKSGRLPPYTIRMLSLLLDDLADSPMIVRSSSLLEDRTNAAFSGKYKSLFLANQGSKAERLQQLTDAVLEVYSSMYNPDSVQYRNERGLIHFTERMGVLIQEVVGRKIGPYFMPLYSGVAFSENPLRWSARINRQSGLVRMVMGLGTRSVDRVNDDYPLLFSPGQPGMRINQRPSDVKRYSQKYIDLINLEKGIFETVKADEFLKNWGAQTPAVGDMISTYTPAQMESKSAFDLDFKNDDMVITFEGILAKNKLPVMISHMLAELSKKMNTPVDIEFAHDGKHMYLLQCRAQSRGSLKEPAPIPQLSPNDLLFTANRFITNARLEGITHIVYVDADAYGELPSKEAMLDVGMAVGRLGGLLPRRKYVLIGPGRWGSRGDIQLGVRVTYSDISNTAALIEVAKEKRGYIPELSFGTHFFQDLVEADIAYLPIYPDQPGAVFKGRLLCFADNMLGELLPQYACLSHVLKVIDVKKSFSGKTLSLYMNADLEQGIAFFADAPMQKDAP
ncbi:MAG: PEP/pyruvate-binding domain-containing protein [Christensenellales bacterium]|jgi:pyruvate,water dikinase